MTTLTSKIPADCLHLVNKIDADYPEAAKNTSSEVRGHLVVTARGKEISFSSPYTDLEAMAQLIAICKGDFAVSLARAFTQGHPKYGRGLSSNQWKWVHKLVHDKENVPAMPSVHLGSAKELSALFDGAAEKIKYPKLTFELPDGRPLRLSRAGARAKFPYSINVTDGGSYGENVWYGRIVHGEFQMSRNADDEVLEFLQGLAENPTEFGKTYGKKSGNCCFCNKQLTQEKSVKAGYGQTCDKNWGLPWGK